MPLPPLDSPELLKELDRLNAQIAKAHKTVVDLCHRRIEWRMSIPADEERDPDLIIGKALRESMQMLARLREAMGEMERLRKFREMIDALRRDEGESVEIIYDNPDFGGPNCVVEVHNYLTETHESFTGETVDECLAAALAKKGAK